jgi:dihydroorotate dehydrogenase electron transfer subunit
MRIYPGRVAELKLHQGEVSALIACPDELVPAAGQYLLAAEKGAILASPLFLADRLEAGFLAASPTPDAWRPGTELSLYGPIGRGFHIPADTKRLALIALGGTNARLLPLLNAPRSGHYDTTLYSAAPFSELPPDLEAYPLRDLEEALSWADFFAIDAALNDLENLTEDFANMTSGQVGFRGQVLIHTPMPCSGLGECGVCAVKMKKSWQLACKDGPVFDLRDILAGVRA